MNYVLICKCGAKELSQTFDYGSVYVCRSCRFSALPEDLSWAAKSDYIPHNLQNHLDVLVAALKRAHGQHLESLNKYAVLLGCVARDLESIISIEDLVLLDKKARETPKEAGQPRCKCGETRRLTSLDGVVWRCPVCN